MGEHEQLTGSFLLPHPFPTSSSVPELGFQLALGCQNERVLVPFSCLWFWPMRCKGCIMRAFLEVSLKACFVSLSCFLEWAHSDKCKNCHQKQFWENQWRMSEPQRGGTGVASNTWNCHTHPALPLSILPLFETERSLCNARPLLLWAFLLPAAELLSDVLIPYFGATFSQPRHNQENFTQRIGPLTHQWTGQVLEPQALQGRVHLWTTSLQMP